MTATMNSKKYIFFSVFAITVGAAALGIMLVHSASSPVRIQPADFQRGIRLDSAHTTPVNLYFSDKENEFLIAEEHTLNHPDNPAFLARSIVESLIKGPQRGLMRTIPEQTAIRAVYITQEGICYVDLTSDIAEHQPGGIKSELLAVYSIANSLVLNVPEVEAVKILINGNEAATLAGHIDLQAPVKANMLLIR
jgi:spore germination protein GerM